jgi:V/A-type H+-transporting ATPase subunit F
LKVGFRKMRVVAFGSRDFISAFQLAGISGVSVDIKENIFEEFNKTFQEKDIGLILVSDDISKLMKRELTEIRAKKSTPLIYELPAPGSPRETFEYRDMLRQILGV